MQVDEAGTERGKALEYELPLNFRFDPNLSPVFSALRFQTENHQEFLGFYFESAQDKADFNQRL